jgi:hypothetical protein
LGLQKMGFSIKLNEIKYTLNGKTIPINVDTTPTIRLRQSIRIGDDCATTVVVCEVKNDGKALKCNSTP